MKKAGVIGHPIAHSKSPFIHGYWLEQYGIAGEYKTYDIAPDHLREGINALITDGLKGFNVTLPHKQHVMELCDTLSDEAKAIGAVNTVTIAENGKLHGHNTDAYGFAQNLVDTVPDFKWSEQVAKIIGAGGAARAIMRALYDQGVRDIGITNRTKESAKMLAAEYNARVIEWDQKNDSLGHTTLLVNTTSLGMKGQDDLDIDLSGLAPHAIIYDIVYVPLHTSLLQQAQSRGLRTVTGIGMLLHQARPGFEAWFGRFPDVTDELTQMILTKK